MKINQSINQIQSSLEYLIFGGADMQWCVAVVVLSIHVSTVINKHIQ